MTFHIGQKVVCVDDSMRVSFKPDVWYKRWLPWKKLSHNLNKGDVYIIGEIQMREDFSSAKKVECLRVSDAWHFGFVDVGFPSWQFRPVIEKKTDISALTALLNPANHKILERT